MGSTPPRTSQDLVEDAPLRVEDLDPDHREGHRRRDGGDVEDGAVDAQPLHGLVQQQGQAEGGQQLQGHAEEGEVEGVVERLVEQGVPAVDQLGQVLHADVIGPGNQVPVQHDQNQGIEHRPYPQEQGAQYEGQREQDAVA